ncbi:uncharacterized protein N7443_006264 [Penicillium atrosanguineum]|uniref:uncharacterized protein n=1 Tax=Penicillium atrosanguineum TaxID=1132637 RepID=UPI0023A2B33E|nr:uncharacterized protein N7443_006264 [Penicillium atrosanguineum]KAJ5298144.1 hypothetical protein N7443_006264 [Penicillium atrosanguineum]
MGQNPSVPRPGARFQVIGAGLSRTGTASFSAALETILDGPVYHGGTQITMGPPIEIKSWVRILQYWLDDKGADRLTTMKLIRHRLDGFTAVTDAPCSQLFEELMEMYPNAKVICTTRDPVSWEESMSQIHHMALLWFLRGVLLPLPGMRHFVHYISLLKKQWVKIYGTTNPNCTIYEQHIAWLKEVVPEDRLMFFDVKDGWEPLCKALDKEVPKDKPFPRINDGAAIDQIARYHIRRGLTRWSAICAMIGVTVALELQIFFNIFYK